MPRSDTRWEGSRAYGPATRLARAIIDQPSFTLTPEEELIGRTLAGMLRDARPVVCPPDQLAAVSDDVFDDLGQAFEYAMAARLPFEVTFFDFLDEAGNGPDMGLHLVEGGGLNLGFELRGVIAGELAEEQRTVFLPITGHREHPPEELGAAFVDWSATEGASAVPSRWRESIAAGGRDLEVTLMSVSAAMEALHEPGRAVPGALLGCIRAESGGQANSELQAVLATATAAAVRTALKVLYLLDSANVELDAIPVSRQVRRAAQRAGTQIAWTVRIRPPLQAEHEDRHSSREYSHRFEVRGNFAHHREGSWLYEHSAPGDLRPCPRCGRCRRVWRASHVKGPADRPLAIKLRRVEFDDGL